MSIDKDEAKEEVEDLATDEQLSADDDDEGRVTIGDGGNVETDVEDLNEESLDQSVGSEYGYIDEAEGHRDTGLSEHASRRSRAMIKSEQGSGNASFASKVSSGEAESFEEDEIQEDDTKREEEEEEYYKEIVSIMEELTERGEEEEYGEEKVEDKELELMKYEAMEHLEDLDLVGEGIMAEPTKSKESEKDISSCIPSAESSEALEEEEEEYEKVAEVKKPVKKCPKKETIKSLKKSTYGHGIEDEYNEWLATLPLWEFIDLESVPIEVIRGMLAGAKEPTSAPTATDSQAEIKETLTPSLKSGDDEEEEDEFSLSIIDRAKFSRYGVKEPVDEHVLRESVVMPSTMKTKTLQRILIENQYFEALDRLEYMRSNNARIQMQMVQFLCRNDKEFNDYTINNDTQEQKELYVKLLSRYIRLYKSWSEIGDLEKEELTKYVTLRKEVDDTMNSLIERKVTALIGKNRNEKSAKFQLVSRLEDAERKKWAEANELQTNNFIIKMQLEKLNQQLKEREIIGGNFTIMGYNQLKHENTVARENILQKYEQCESVLKNTKITAQKMSHIKEKLNFVRNQHKTRMENLFSKEKKCDQLYQELKAAKQARVKARQILANLQSKNDLLSYPELLMDYESGLDKTLHLKNDMTLLSKEYMAKLYKLKALTKNLNKFLKLDNTMR